MKFLCLLFFTPLLLCAQLEERSVPSPFYGGDVIAYELADNGKSKILFCAASNGLGLYYSHYPKSGHRRDIRWQEADTVLKEVDYTYNDIHRMGWHATSQKLFFGTTYDLYQLSLDSTYKHLMEARDFLLLGDTLIIAKQGPRIDRYIVESNGSLRLLSSENLSGLGNGNSYYRLALNPKTHRLVLYGREMYRSTRRYFTPFDSLRFFMEPLNTNASGEYGSFAIDPNGDWWIANPTFWDPNGGQDTNKTHPWRSIIKSLDKWDWYTPDILRGPWAIRHEIPQGLHWAKVGDQMHMLYGELYFRSNDLYANKQADWELIGTKARPHGAFIRAGVSLFHPEDPSIAFHTSNYGPASSTHYSDSLFIANKGIRASSMVAGHLDAKGEIWVNHSERQVAVAIDPGSPYESWLYFRKPGRSANQGAIVFNPHDGYVYYAGDKIYRRKATSPPWEVFMDTSDLAVDYPNEANFLDFAIDPTNGLHMAGIIENENDGMTIYYTNDGGDSWDTLSAGERIFNLAHLRFFPSETGVQLHFSQTAHSFPAAPWRYVYYDFSGDKIAQKRFDIDGYGFGTFMEDFAQDANNQFFALGQRFGNPGGGLLNPLLSVLAYENNAGGLDTLRLPIRLSNGETTFMYSGLAIKDSLLFIGQDYELLVYKLKDGVPALFRRLENAVPETERILDLYIKGDFLLITTNLGARKLKISDQESSSLPEVGWNLYPNPSSSEIRIQPVGKISIFSTAGNLMYRSDKSEYKVDISALPPGLYYIRHDQAPEALRFIKN